MAAKTILSERDKPRVFTSDTFSIITKKTKLMRIMMMMKGENSRNVGIKLRVTCNFNQVWFTSIFFVKMTKGIWIINIFPHNKSTIQFLKYNDILFIASHYSGS